jgi:hypothetical protein
MVNPQHIPAKVRHVDHFVDSNTKLTEQVEGKSEFTFEGGRKLAFALSPNETKFKDSAITVARLKVTERGEATTQPEPPSGLAVGAICGLRHGRNVQVFDPGQVTRACCRRHRSWQSTHRPISAPALPA